MRHNRRINSLMYHDLVEDHDTSASGFIGAAADRYKQTPDNFESHLKAIEAKCGMIKRPVSVELALSSEGDAPWVATFDDGGVSAVDTAARLERHGGVGHFFVTTSRIGTDGFLNEEQIRHLHKSGHIVGSHSHTHPAPISALDDDCLKNEWEQSVQTLTEILDAPVTVASVPGGYYSKRVVQAAELSGIRTLFTSEPTSRVFRIGKCTVLGRFAILRQTPAHTAAAYAAGEFSTCLRQRIVWDSKKLVKWVLGRRYHSSASKFHEYRKPAGQSQAFQRTSSCTETMKMV